MFNRLNPLVIAALFTSCAMMAFAFYERQNGPIAVSASTFYIAAAIICVLPSLYGAYRHKRCQARKQRT